MLRTPCSVGRVALLLLSSLPAWSQGDPREDPLDAYSKVHEGLIADGQEITPDVLERIRLHADLMERARLAVRMSDRARQEEIARVRKLLASRQESLGSSPGKQSPKPDPRNRSFVEDMRARHDRFARGLAADMTAIARIESLTERMAAFENALEARLAIYREARALLDEAEREIARMKIPPRQSRGGREAARRRRAAIKAKQEAEGGLRLSRNALGSLKERIQKLLGYERSHYMPGSALGFEVSEAAAVLQSRKRYFHMVSRLDTYRPSAAIRLGSRDHLADAYSWFISCLEKPTVEERAAFIAAKRAELERLQQRDGGGARFDRQLLRAKALDAIASRLVRGAESQLRNGREIQISRVGHDARAVAGGTLQQIELIISGAQDSRVIRSLKAIVRSRRPVDAHPILWLSGHPDGVDSVTIGPNRGLVFMGDFEMELILQPVGDSYRLEPLPAQFWPDVAVAVLDHAALLARRLPAMKAVADREVSPGAGATEARAVSAAWAQLCSLAEEGRFVELIEGLRTSRDHNLVTLRGEEVNDRRGPLAGAGGGLGELARLKDSHRKLLDLHANQRALELRRNRLESMQREVVRGPGRKRESRPLTEAAEAAYRSEAAQLKLDIDLLSFFLAAEPDVTLRQKRFSALEEGVLDATLAWSTEQEELEGQIRALDKEQRVAGIAPDAWAGIEDRQGALGKRVRLARDRIARWDAWINTWVTRIEDDADMHATITGLIRYRLARERDWLQDAAFLKDLEKAKLDPRRSRLAIKKKLMQLAQESERLQVQMREQAARFQASTSGALSELVAKHLRQDAFRHRGRLINASPASIGRQTAVVVSCASRTFTLLIQPAVGDGKVRSANRHQPSHQFLPPNGPALGWEIGETGAWLTSLENKWHPFLVTAGPFDIMVRVPEGGLDRDLVMDLIEGVVDLGALTGH